MRHLIRLQEASCVIGLCLFPQKVREAVFLNNSRSPYKFIPQTHFQIDIEIELPRLTAQTRWARPVGETVMVQLLFYEVPFFL